MFKKKLLLGLMSILLLLPLVHHAQYDEQGNQIVLTDVSANPLVYKLPNGLTVVLYADKSLPQVTGMVVTLAGGKNDLPDATGMAHYMEHMLFKGTTKIGTTNWSEESKHIQRIFELYDSLAIAKDPEQKKQIQMRINDESLLANQYAIPNELDRILKEMGSTGINAGTGPDYTVYYNIFPPHQMERWLEVYSHRFSSPVFRSFQSELEVVYEEKNMYSDMFFMNLFEAFNQSFYKVHPYGQQPLIGTMEHLKNPSLTKMKEFYDRWYVANNMGLIITGDFNIDEVMPLIQEKFGSLPKGKLPEKISWVENPFSGREFVQKKLSPVKIGLLGYRIPANGHPDKLVMEVMSGILSNRNGTGLLDKLSLDNKLLQAAAQNVHYADYGTGLIIFVPKIVGQSLDEAELLVLDQIKKLRNGEFSDSLFEAIKLNMYRDKVMALENSTNLAYAFLDAFTSGSDFNDVWNQPQRVRKISRDEVLRVAKEYYGDDFLAFHSTMGFPKKEKIEKPGYAPVTKQQDESSQYYHMISEMPEKKPEYRFVDFNRDISRIETSSGVRIFSVENLQNDVFSLTIKYGIGEGNMPILQYASQMMNLSGTSELTQDEFRLRMAMLGCTYDIQSNDSYLILNLTGLEENLVSALTLLNSLVQSPKLDQKKLATLYTGEKANRKLERSEPDMIADALMEYVLYGEKSSYIDRLSLKEIKKLQADSLVAAFRLAMQYAPEIHYAGRRSIDEVGMLFGTTFVMQENYKSSTAPFYRSPAVYLRNEVYLTPKKKAAQSKVFFHATLNEFDPGQNAVYTAFNAYFGGDFSGIVLQEIREYRSMAYSAGASIVQPPVKSQRMVFKGFVGTQADKTTDAVDIFAGLVRQMPQKPDRIQMIKRYITAAAATQRPGFRSLSQSYVSWKHKGYEQDPAATMVDRIIDLSPNDIFDYQQINMANTPLTIMIVGDAKRFDKKALEKHGKLIILKEKVLFSK